MFSIAECAESASPLDAVREGLACLSGFVGTVFVIPIDMPLLETEDTLACMEAMLISEATNAQVSDCPKQHQGAERESTWCICLFETKLSLSYVCLELTCSCWQVLVVGFTGVCRLFSSSPCILRDYLTHAGSLRRTPQPVCNQASASLLCRCSVAARSG